MDNIKNENCSCLQKIIDIKKLKQNVNVFKKLLGSSKLCAVVKANAYGHGDDIVVNSIKNMVDFFAVACQTEALRVRQYTNKPILILGEIEKSQIEKCLKNNISLSVSNEKTIKQILSVARKLGIVAKIHFKINTGMNRLGFKDKDLFLRVYNKYKYEKYLQYEGIFSHIFDADCYEKTRKQKQIFDEILTIINDDKIIKHLASTSVTTKYKNMNYDMARIGIGLYNYSFDNKWGLSPIMSLKTKVVNIVNIKKGEYVSYGDGFKAERKTKVAVLKVGYADGYSRKLSNKGYVIINNNYCKIIGNICMDMMMVDVTNVKVKIGDDAILIGQSEDKKINAIELANLLQTIDYEILTSIKNDRVVSKIVY